MSLSDLSESIRLELSLLHQLMDESADLRQAVRDSHPTPADRLAAGTMLLSFYNGVENIFRQVLDQLDGGAPSDPDARHSILPAVAAAGRKRPPVISDDCRTELQQYLDFRESFRYGHLLRLSWETIAPLAANCQAALARLEAELGDFLAAVGAGDASAPPAADVPSYWTYPQRRRRLTPFTAAYVLGLGLTLLLGLWLGIGGHALFLRITGGDDYPEMPAELVQPYIDAAELPNIPTMDNTPAQMLPDESWTFRLDRGKVEGASLREFTGRIVGISYPHPVMRMDIADGRLAVMTIGPQVYRFDDGRPSRYEVNPTRHLGEDTYFHEIWQLNRAGQIVHLSTRNDRQWRPKWLSVDADPLAPGRWEMFWSGNRLVMQMHADAAGQPRTIRVRNGEEFTVFSFGPDGTADVTREPAP